MDRRVKEAIRSTMLMQDRVLKEQVKELHRLYDVQRKLTEELKRESGQDLMNPNTDSEDIVDNPTFPFTLVNYFNLESQSFNKKSDLDLMDRPSTSTAVGNGKSRNNEDDDDDEDGKVDLRLSLGFGGGSSKTGM